MNGRDTFRASTDTDGRNRRDDYLNAKSMEIIESPSGLQVLFEATDRFFENEHALKGRAIAAAGAELLMVTAATAAGQNASASIISMTLEMLDEVHKGQIVGIGTISRMGANIAFVEGQILSDGHLCSRLTGSCKIEK